MSDSKSSRQRKRYPVAIVRVLLSVLGSLPLSVSRKLAVVFAFLAWHFNTRAARTTLQNIEHCYPELDHEAQIAFARESLFHTACTFLEMPATWTRSLPTLKSWIREVHGEGLLRDGKANGSVLMLLPHFGNWEFLITYMATVTKYSCLYSPRRLYELDEMINRCRSRFGSEFLPVTHAGLRMLMKRLQAGGVFVVLPDQVPTVDGQAIDSTFRNKPIKTGMLPHSLLKRFDMKALSMVAERCHGGFNVYIEEINTEIYSEDASESIQALDHAIEKAIERDPAQYQWEYKRFRGSAEIYS